MEPDSLSFPALITKLQSHLALSGPSVFCKIPMRSMYVHDQVKPTGILKVSIGKRMANIFLSISSHIFCKTDLY